MGLITLSIAIFSALSFLISYGFLFGYYFGGEIDNSFSNFEIFRRFVPFHLNTMTFTYLMISLSVTLIIYSLKFLKGKGIIFKFITLLCLIIFHIMMTVFFSQEINLTNILLFSAIWVFPVFIVIMVLFFVQGIRVPFKTFSGALVGLSLLVILALFFQINVSEEWILIWLNIALFSFGILFSRVFYKKYWNFIFIFPYIFLLLVIAIRIIWLDYFKEQSDFIKVVILLGIPLLISIILSIFFRKKFKERNNVVSNDSGSISKIILEILPVVLNSKMHKEGLTFIIIMLLMAYVMTPRVSTATAKIIRSFTPASEFQFDLISVKDLEDKPKTIKGIIVAEQDGVIYISNEDWELEQVKTNSYFVKRAKD